MSDSELLSDLKWEQLLEDSKYFGLPDLGFDLTAANDDDDM